MQDETETGDGIAAVAILEHVRAHVGPVDSVFQEFDEDGLAIDIHHVPPTPARQCHTLVTSGMSDRPMPAGGSVHFAELTLSLPADWPFSEEELDDESAFWPLGLLRALGRLPHEHRLTYDFGLITDDPALPLGPARKAGFAGVLLAPPVTTADAFWCLDAGNGKVIDFIGVVMLTPDEVALARAEGVVALAHRLDARGITELARPGRQPAV